MPIEHLAGEHLAISERNYRSHVFEDIRQSTPGEPDEIFRICKKCGAEDYGDPQVHTWLSYPACGAEDE